MAITGGSVVAFGLLQDAGALRLHSQFDSGVNLECLDYLVYVGTDVHGGACALEVAREDLDVLRSQEQWRWTGDALVGAGAEGRVALDAAPVAYPVAPPTVPGLAGGDPRRLARARAAVGGGSWFDSDTGRRLGLPRLRVAVEALVHGGPDAARTVVTVVGLGSGLTPSADDALIGALCTLAADSRPVSETARRVEAWLNAEGASATTDVSASYLRLALQGAFSTPLGRLVAALSDDVPDVRLIDAVRDLGEIGATSGMDAVVGVQIAWEQLVAAGPHDL